MVCGGMKDDTGTEILDVTVVLVDDGYASTAIAPLEVFSSAGVLFNRFTGRRPQPRFRVTPASVDGEAIRSAHHMQVVPEVSIDEVRKTDLVIVSATGLNIDSALADHRPLLPWLRKWADRGAYIAGGCAGVAFLAEAGLLDGRRATTHWALAEEFAGRYPAVNWHPEAFVTEDEGIFCGGGVYGLIDLSLYLVEKLSGHETAVECAKAMLVEMPRMNQLGFAVLPLATRHGDDAIRQAEEWLQERYQEAVRVEDLAARFGMSPRNFERRFKAATSRMPRAYLQKLRVTRAQHMLESGSRSVEQVAVTVGYNDVAFFREVFKRHTGMSPASYRARFGPSSGANASRSN